MLVSSFRPRPSLDDLADQMDGSLLLPEMDEFFRPLSPRSDADVADERGSVRVVPPEVSLRQRFAHRMRSTSAGRVLFGSSSTAADSPGSSADTVADGKYMNDSQGEPRSRVERLYLLGEERANVLR